MLASLSSHVSMDDLEGYGAEGLIDAVDRYDPARGVQFSTFASYRIRGAIYDGIRAEDWVPRSVRRKARELDRSRAALAAAQGEQPTEDEEASALEISVAALRAWKSQAALAQLTSLDYETAPEHVPSPEVVATQEPLAAYLVEEERQAVNRAIARLPERERSVVSMSFGAGLTLAEIGQRLGVTESRVCQIRTAALKRIRVYLRSAGVLAAAS
jgi:RNA polymerase sigma factor for flagellar operon FliA